MLVFTELQKGTDPAKIIEMLSADPAFQSRQFGIVDLQGRIAGHSGLTNGYVSQDIQGHVPGTEIFYSIQGNILRPGEVVPHAVKAFLETKGALTDRVMAAMDAADAVGRRQPLHVPAAAGRRIDAGDSVRRQDRARRLHPDGRGQRTRTASRTTTASTRCTSPSRSPARTRDRIRSKQGENLNPVKTLRMRYDAWRKLQPATYK